MTKAARLNQQPVFEPDALNCPFCGEQATIEFYHGGRPSKRLISCSSTTCEVRPSVTGETHAKALSHWNLRTPSQNQ